MSDTLNSTKSIWSRLVSLHKLNALLLGVFIFVHLITHGIATFGPDAHAAFLASIRKVYRATFVEPILVGLFVMQVALGSALFLKRFGEQQKNYWSWIQLISGAYLAIFILNHIFLGVLMGRTFEGVIRDFILYHLL